ncbi:hypothetical protein PV08_04743 [Exophiala spinifera]|uniref:Major facilitator superfamily (MFS) profile domain-containing protein n=1 Tax=Exophiala spinifera TaxID=91928 RepID=A0A0D2C1M1_9EURO|nr:uncharacterized protein PV08_04743 [Exophiala spinifera]KIW17549.1 hypothetical protein PV08_04743 [Exophiala spinifera]
MAEKSGNTEFQIEDTGAGPDSNRMTKVDTLHGDEAVIVLEAYDGESTWTKEEERRLVRKIDLRLLPILIMTFGLTFYDKVQLAHAAIFGLTKDLDLLVGNRYSMSSSIFYLGYISGSYPAVLLAQRYPIQRVIFGITFVWGLCVISCAGAFNYQGLFAQRFFLGVLESGISPVWMMVVGGWYRKEEQTFRMGVWYSAASIMSLLAPIVNYGLGHINGSLAPWRYMFIVAGVITTLWAFVILFVLESDPIHAKSLNEREKFIAISRLRENNSGIRNRHFKAPQLWELLTSAHFWLVFFMAVTINVSNAVPTTFNPIIIKAMGFSGLNALLLTMPTGGVGLVTTLGTAFLMAKYSKHNLRTLVIAGEVSLMLLSCCLMWQLPHAAVGARLFFLYLLSFYPAAYSLIMNLSIANAAGYTKRALTSSGLFVGYCCGNLIGPFLFLEHERPLYHTAWTSITVLTAICVLLALTYRLLCLWENKKREDAGFTESFEHAYEDDVTDRKNPHFRYIY